MRSEAADGDSEPPDAGRSVPPVHQARPPLREAGRGAVPYLGGPPTPLPEERKGPVSETTDPPNAVQARVNRAESQGRCRYVSTPPPGSTHMRNLPDYSVYNRDTAYYTTARLLTIQQRDCLLSNRETAYCTTERLLTIQQRDCLLYNRETVIVSSLLYSLLYSKQSLCCILSSLSVV